MELHSTICSIAVLQVNAVRMSMSVTDALSSKPVWNSLLRCRWKYPGHAHLNSYTITASERSYLTAEDKADIIFSSLLHDIIWQG